MTDAQCKYAQWLTQVADNPEYRAELEAICDNKEEITERFYRDLSFGTAGLRGILGLGTNRMNIYTVRQATQGLADYLNRKTTSPSAAIAYDSRNCSALFAREAAQVLSANGITVHLYAELMPTPALSFAVRELGCDAGIVITASHNPAAYNGYKVYGSDGGQLGPEAASQVLACIRKTDLFTGTKLCEFDQAIADGHIRLIPEEFVQQYINRVFAEALQPEVCAKAGLKLVYTPLNGAGRHCVYTVLAKAGIENITIVKEQEYPDGNFPTCPYPNPETKEALQLGLDLCRKTDADLLLATDPDADRVAVAVKYGDDYRILTGNEAGILLLDYICRTRRANNTMPQKPVAVRSIVSSRLTDAIAAEYGVEVIRVLTGFKYVGETIRTLEKNNQSDRFIFGYEESCGYLSGTYARDKDAINASLLLVEMASAAKLEGRTLVDALDDIAHRHGIYRDTVENFVFEGAQGMAHMDEIMNTLRFSPLQTLGGDRVSAHTDYQTGIHEQDGNQTPTGLPCANVLEYRLENGCSVIIRPSGTEPKIKVYYSIIAKTEQQAGEIAKKYRTACAEFIR